MLNRDQLAAEAITEKLRHAKVGVISKGLDLINPGKIAEMVSSTLERPLCVSIIGYSGIEASSNVTISTNIEDAVDWRSTPELAGRILVFIQDEVPKLHSLGDLEFINSRDITRHLIKWAAESREVTITQPQVRFWEALAQESATFPLNLVEDFVSSIVSDRSNLNAIPENLWRLGLLKDDALLNSNKDPVERLQRNRELLVEIGLLSEQSRKRLSGVLSRASSSDRSRLQTSFIHLKNFYRTGAIDILKQLDLPTVEELIRASRPTTVASRRAGGGNNTTTGGETNGGNSGSDTSTRPLRGRQLAEVIADQTVNGSEESQRGLRELGEALRNHIRDAQQSTGNVTISPGFNERTIQLETPDNELLKFIGQTCSESSWGGVLTTYQNTIKGAVSRYTPDAFKAYNPADMNQGISGQCLFSLLKHFDTYVIRSNSFETALNHLIDSRNVLLKYLDLLLAQPFVLFGGYPDAREALIKYLAAYSDILRTFRQYEAEMHGHDSNALRFVATEILRLEVIHIRTPNAWKAMLTPLHPFHLWRYKEVLSSIHAEDRQLNNDEKEQLAEALPDLPHMIHFLVFSPDVSGNENVVLPLAGAYETLPTFENRTNRYLGNDGLDYLLELLHKYERDAPYSRTQIRLGIVDAPDITAVMKLLAEYLSARNQTQLIVEAYFTRGQNPTGEMARLDYEDKDHELGELLNSGRIRVQFNILNSTEAVCEALKERPVHVAFMFDQSVYQINHAPRARQLLVSPLVISYQYDYSETFHRGTIAPSSEAEDGLFSDFHFLVERAANLPAGQQLRLQYESHEGLGPINALLNNGATKWLAIADRALTGYAPENAVLLSEAHCGQREVAVWARTSTRSVGQFIDLLRRFNLRPNTDVVSALLHRFGHIASGGVMTLLSSGGNAQYREAQQKGYLGTVIAAAWYSKEHTGSLIASLDSKLARQWLKGRGDNGKRADLIGLRIDNDGSLVIEPIEVKTLAEGSETRVERNEQGQRVLVGQAIEQLRSMLDILAPIFGDQDNDQQPLFTPARREVLRYQLHRECFREVHEPEWQSKWYQTLKNAFSLPTPRIVVKLSGIVLNVKFEENSGQTIVQDESEPLTLVTLGTQAIQKLVTDDDSGSDSTEVTTTTESGADQGTTLELSESVDELRRTCSNDGETSHIPVRQNLPYNDSMGQVIGGGNELANVAEQRADFVATSTSDSDSNVSPEDELEAEELSRLFRRACQSYRISLEECDPAKAVVGPTVWRFFIRLARGQRLDPLRNSLEDIGREMRKSGLLVSTIPDSDYIALDIPRRNRRTIALTEGLRHLPRITSPEQMPIIIGVTPENECLIHDLGKMPHLLVGGTTGSGKTVFLYGLLTSLLQTHPTPSTLRLMVSTSKPEDFMFFEGLPHLETGEIIADAGDAIRLLETNVRETFEERLTILRESRCRDIVEYNSTHPENPLPPLVVIVDEFADLADQLSSDRVAREAFYTNVRRIAQLGRSRGIHLVLCTQRPSRDLVPTNIRNLMNARVSLRVNDATASRMILEESGGEQLQKHGDLLYKDEKGLVRAQGYFISTQELVEFLNPLMS
jgi:hypothetical protein